MQIGPVTFLYIFTLTFPPQMTSAQMREHKQ